MRRSWFGWRDRAISYLAKLAVDGRVPEELREEAAKTARYLGKLNSRYKLPRSKMLNVTANVTLLAAKAVLHGVVDAAVAVAPEPVEIDDLAEGFGDNPRAAFSAWKAKVVAALTRAAVATANPESKVALVDLAEMLAGLQKPRRAKSWYAKGARFLIALADLVKTAAEESGSEELASLVPTLETVNYWLGGTLPPPPKRFMPKPEKRPFTQEGLKEWITKRLALEKGRSARVPMGELTATFKLPPNSVERVRSTFKMMGEIQAGGKKWKCKGVEIAKGEKHYRRVVFLFTRVE